MGTSERHFVRKTDPKRGLFLVVATLAATAIGNKLFRGNWWGVPTENDVIMHNFFEPTDDGPSNTFGFVGDTGPSVPDPRGRIQ